MNGNQSKVEWSKKFNLKLKAVQACSNDYECKSLSPWLALEISTNRKEESSFTSGKLFQNINVGVFFFKRFLFWNKILWIVCTDKS